MGCVLTGELRPCHSTGMAGWSRAATGAAKGALGMRPMKQNGALQREPRGCFDFSTLSKSRCGFHLKYRRKTETKPNQTKLHQNGKEKVEGTAILCYFISVSRCFKMYFPCQKTGGGNQDKKNYFLNSIFFPDFTPGEKNLGNAPHSENVEASLLISNSQD